MTPHPFPSVKKICPVQGSFSRRIGLLFVAGEKIRLRNGSKAKTLLAVLLAGFLIWQRRLVWQALIQLLYGSLVALAALPLMRLAEKKCKPGLAAALALAGLAAGLLILMGSLSPSLAQQGRQLSTLLPVAAENAMQLVRSGEEWLSRNGIPVDETLRTALMERSQELVTTAAPKIVDWAQRAADSLSKWLLAPAFAYYFLRDRREIGAWLLLLLPVEKRSLTLRLLREIRRETTGYLRGQLMISAVVAVVTAAGLLLCGVPAWLLLGVLMGLLELIPYVGPFVGGGLVVLFSLEEGLSTTLWALGVVVAVQQLEGSILSPKMTSEVTRLSPITVLLCILLGGSAGGVIGLLAAVPLALCVRTCFRVYCLNRTDQVRAQNEKKVKYS